MPAQLSNILCHENLNVKMWYMRRFCLCFSYISSCDYLAMWVETSWNFNDVLSANILYLTEVKCTSRHLTYWSSFPYKQHYNSTMKHCYKETSDNSLTRGHWLIIRNMGHHHQSSGQPGLFIKAYLWVLKKVLNIESMMEMFYFIQTVETYCLLTSKSPLLLCGINSCILDFFCVC